MNRMLCREGDRDGERASESRQSNGAVWIRSRVASPRDPALDLLNSREPASWEGNEGKKRLCRSSQRVREELGAVGIDGDLSRRSRGREEEIRESVTDGARL